MCLRVVDNICRSVRFGLNGFASINTSAVYEKHSVNFQLSVDRKCACEFATIKTNYFGKWVIQIV